MTNTKSCRPESFADYFGMVQFFNNDPSSHSVFFFHTCQLNRDQVHPQPGLTGPCAFIVQPWKYIQIFLDQAHDTQAVIVFLKNS